MSWEVVLNSSLLVYFATKNTNICVKTWDSHFFSISFWRYCWLKLYFMLSYTTKATWVITSFLFIETLWTVYSTFFTPSQNSESNLINADLGLAINAFSVSSFIYLSLMYSGIYITGLLSILLPFSSSSLNSPSLEDMLSSDSDDPSEELSPDLLSSEDDDLLRFARFA